MSFDFRNNYVKMDTVSFTNDEIHVVVVGAPNTTANQTSLYIAIYDGSYKSSKPVFAYTFYMFDQPLAKLGIMLLPILSYFLGYAQCISHKKLVIHISNVAMYMYLNGCCVYQQSYRGSVKKTLVEFAKFCYSNDISVTISKLSGVYARNFAAYVASTTEDIVGVEYDVECIQEAVRSEIRHRKQTGCMSII